MLRIWRLRLADGKSAVPIKLDELVRAAGREPQKVQGEEGVGFSVITQKHLVDSLKAKPELQGFMDCVQRVEQMKERNSQDSKEYFFGALPAKVINEVQKELPANIDLRRRKAQGYSHRLARHNLKGDSIEKRPIEVADRQEAGHHEMDLVVSAKGGKKISRTL